MNQTKYYITIFACLLAFTSGYSQQWRYYTNTDYISSIAVSPSNELWIGTNGGVVRYDPETQTRRIFTRTDGLASAINAIAVAPDGHIWAGGSPQPKLSEFDGVRWIAHKIVRGTLFVNLLIDDMVFDKDGVLWIAGSTTVIKFFQGTFTEINLPVRGQVSSIASDQNNNIWIGYYSEGIAVLKPDGSWVVYDTLLASNSVYDIAVDTQGRVWVASVPDLSGNTGDGGVSMFDGTNWTILNTSNSGLPSNWVDRIGIDNDGNVWAACLSNEVSEDCRLRSIIAKYDRTNWTLYDNSIVPSLDGARLRAISFNATGNVYFGTTPDLGIEPGPIFGGGGELLKFNGTEWSTISIRSTTLPYSPVWSMAAGKSGNIWLGTIQNGIVLYDGSSWENFDVKNIPLFSSNWINDIAIDKKGAVWFVGGNVSVGCQGGGGSFEGGVTKFDGSEWITYTTSNSGLVDNNVQSVATDDQGNTWFGTFDKGVSKYDGTTWTTYSTSNSDIASNSLSAIAIDSSGSIWFAHHRAGEGVSNFDGVNWTIYTTSNSGLPNNFVNDMAVDTKGNIWFLCAFGGGENKLSKFDGTNWATYDVPTSYSIEIDKQNSVLWLATYRNGVLSFDGTTWSNYDLSNSPIGYDEIKAIAIDSYGNKWFSSAQYEGGISVFNENGITAVDPSHDESSLPLDFSLFQNYPNPFNASTTIRFSLPKPNHVTLKVFDILGRQIAVLIDQRMHAGEHQMVFQADNLSSGIYFYHLSSSDPNGLVKSKKMVLLK